MDEAKVFDIFTDKVRNKDLYDAVIESYEEITVSVFKEVLGKDLPKLLSARDWLILADTAKARSKLLPFLSFENEKESIYVSARGFTDLTYAFAQFQIAVSYIIENYEKLGRNSDFHSLWTTDKLKLVLKEITNDFDTYPNRILKVDGISYTKVPSVTLMLMGKMFHLVLYAIMGKDYYEKYAAKSKQAMRFLSKYRDEFIPLDRRVMN